MGPFRMICWLVAFNCVNSSALFACEDSDHFYRLRNTKVFYFLSDGRISAQEMKLAESAFDPLFSVMSHPRLTEFVKLNPKDSEQVRREIAKHRHYVGSIEGNGPPPDRFDRATRADLIVRQKALKSLIESKLSIEDFNLCVALSIKSSFYDLGPVEWCQFIGGSDQEIEAVKEACLQLLDELANETSSMESMVIDKLFDGIDREKRSTLLGIVQSQYFPPPGNITNLYDSLRIRQDFGSTRASRAWLDPAFKIGACGFLERYPGGMLATQTDTRIRDMLESLKYVMDPSDLVSKPRIMELFEEYMLNRHVGLSNISDPTKRFEKLEKFATVYFRELSTLISYGNLRQFDNLRLFAASERYGLVDVAFSHDVEQIMGENALSQKDYDSLEKRCKNLSVTLREKDVLTERKIILGVFRETAPKTQALVANFLRCPENTVPPLEILVFHFNAYKDAK